MRHRQKRIFVLEDLCKDVRISVEMRIEAKESRSLQGLFEAWELQTGQQRDLFNGSASPLMVSYRIIWQGNSTSQAVARILSNAYVTILVADGTPTIECPSTSLAQSGVKTLPPGIIGFQEMS